MHCATGVFVVVAIELWSRNRWKLSTTSMSSTTTSMIGIDDGISFSINQKPGTASLNSRLMRALPTDVL